MVESYAASQASLCEGADLGYEELIYLCCDLLSAAQHRCQSPPDSVEDSRKQCRRILTLQHTSFGANCMFTDLLPRNAWHRNCD